MSLLARTGLPVVGALVLGPLMLGPAGAAGATNGQVCMGVVIDDGGYGGTGPAAVQVADVDPGSSDLQALQAAHDTPYQNNSGLVCAIDDGTGQVPTNGVQNCLSTAGNGQYFYWSYWEGDPYTNTWTYANVGPASHTVSAGQTYVEGWRYQDPGPDNPSATKPSVSPGAAFAQACPGVTPVPSGASGGGGGGGGSGSGGGGGGSTGGPAPAPASPSPSTTTTTAVPGNGSAGARTAPAGTTSPGISTTTTSHPGTGAKAPPGAAHGTSISATTGSSANTHDGQTVLADQRGHDGTGGGDPTLPIVIVAIVILALGGLAWWRWRRRPLEE
jgi:hypothetical protein